VNDARLAATRILIALEAGDTTLSHEIERARRAVADDRDRGLLVEVAHGTLRWRNAIDAVLASCMTRRIDQLTPATRAILRVAAYQLLYLDRVPDHAVLDDSVELTRVLRDAHASGFVNAVLRAVTRARAKSPLPARPGPGASTGTQVRYLSLTLSHPEWLVRRWLDRFGFEAAEAWCTFNNQSPPVTVRVDGNVDAIVDEARAAGAEVSPARWVARAITLAPGAFGRLPAGMRDTLFVQDEASQIVAEAAAHEATGRVLDVCAAPGGKTIILASALAGRGTVTASDRRPSRVRLLRSLIARARVPVQVLAVDAARGLPFGDRFDRVLLDAPCSGLGTVRRDPDVKWARTAPDLERLAAQQRRMIVEAARVVRPGGDLIYATCSSEPDENDDVVRWFLSTTASFAPAPLAPGPGVHDAGALLEPDGVLRTLPFRHGLDAFFAARLVRRRDA
jgi:16S rRNA (cytosine967-C5)-methyltransferase